MILEVLHAGHVVHRQPVGRSPLSLGRGADNALVLRDAGVSTHHALVFRDGEALLVRDLGSTNGTFLDDEPVLEPTRLGVGQVLRLGPRTRLRLAEGEGSGTVSPGLQVELVDGPLAWPIDRAHFPLPGTEAVLLVREEHVHLALDGSEREILALGTPFEVERRRFVLRELQATGDTVRPTEDRLPYELVVDLGGNVARLVDAEREVRITASTQVALLHVLTARWLEDRGWVDDETAIRAVWGRPGLRHNANNLNVLVFRVRKKVEDAGLSRWFLERRPGALRLRVLRARHGGAG